MHPALIAWAIYVFLVPFYVFKSGLPQPGDVFVLVLVPVVLATWNGRLPRPSLLVLKPLLWFTVWVFLVNVGWALSTGRLGLVGPNTFLMYPTYYLYNAFIFLVVLVLYRRHTDVFLRLTLYIVYASIALLVASSLVSPSSLRGSLFFNNPNQLGYYTLLAACLVVLLHWRLRLSLIASSTALVSCAYLALVSASRSSAAGIGILFALLVFSNPRVIVLVSLAAVALLFAGGPVADALDASQQRAMRAHDVSFFDERGYDRIWEHAHYLFFGAGEGGFWRFAETSRVRNMEIHSSIGTIVFSYGLIGSLLFVWFCWRVVRGAPLRMTLVLLPPLLYSVAHQGLRFTVLWVLLAIFVVLKEDARRPAPSRAARIPIASPRTIA